MVIKNVRSRRKQILVLVLCGGLIFLTFQFYSLVILSHPSGLPAHENVDIKIVRGNRHIQKPLIIEEEYFDHKEKAMEPSDRIHEPIVGEKEEYFKQIPRGVHKTDAKFYQKSRSNTFRCITSKKEILFENVNDDFCDCEDSSDEPGTSACRNGRFYCTFQLAERLPQHIPSSRVNDGLCDCCDGSDEWKNLSPPLNVVKAANKTETMITTPCPNLCDKLVQQKRQDEKVRSMGIRLKQRYLDAASFLDDRSKLDYGPNGVFYKLSKSCFNHKSGGYEYEVCPFKHVFQQNFPQARKNIGQHSTWKHQQDGLYILSMTDGDGSLCPDGFSRSSMISFMCGLQDQVIEVAESEKCTYFIKFSTPAAC